MNATLSAKEVAAALDVSPRQLRKFLRSTVKANGGQVGVDTPGKGKRYSFEKKEVAGLKKAFAAWAEANKKAEVEVTEADTEAA